MNSQCLDERATNWTLAVALITADLWIRVVSRNSSLFQQNPEHCLTLCKSSTAVQCFKRLAFSCHLKYSTLFLWTGSLLLISPWRAGWLSVCLFVPDDDEWWWRWSWWRDICRCFLLFCTKLKIFLWESHLLMPVITT